jgi:hypothetical protein
LSRISASTTTTTTQLSSEKKGFGPSIPAFRFSDNIMGSQKPRVYRDLNYNDNGNMNSYNNGESNGMRTVDANPPMQQSPAMDPLPPPPPQQQSLAPEPINPNMNKAAPAMSYLEQLQQQQQQQQTSPTPPPATSNPASEQAPQQQQQQPVVYNDFSEYERQLRQFTQGH